MQHDQRLAFHGQWLLVMQTFLHLVAAHRAVRCGQVVVIGTRMDVVMTGLQIARPTPLRPASNCGRNAWCGKEIRLGCVWRGKEAASERRQNRESGLAIA